MATVEKSVTDWHAMPARRAIAALRSDHSGLTHQEAGARLARYGPNRLPDSGRRGRLFIFLRQFANPLIYLLLAAALVSLLIGQLIDALFIAGVLLLNSLLGAFQEVRADTSASALRSLIPYQARVRRDGQLMLVDSENVVPGDMVELESGRRITADLRLIESHRLRTDESTLSGESVPVAKDAAAVVGAAASLPNRTGMAHAGSLVAQGRGTGVVVATGAATAIGRISQSLGQAERAGAPPPLVRRMARLTHQIAIASVVIIGALALLLALEGQGWREIFLLSVALAVSAIPEGLPIAVTVALSAATRRMAKRNVIVRALPAVEGLGACTIIASDKTGTLTQNRLSVERILVAGMEAQSRSDWTRHGAAAPLRAIAKAGLICNEAHLSDDGDAVGDMVDVALVRFARENGIDFASCLDRPRLTITAYEPALRYAAVASDETLFVKGAPETIIAMCDQPDSELIDQAEELAGGGYRLLALAEGKVPPNGQRPSGLKLLGFVGLFDPLRPEVPDAIARCRSAGIDVMMITGDHPVTARAIAEQLGMDSDPGQVVTGSELAVLGDDPRALALRIRDARVFARIEPAQKFAIVRTLHQHGEKVAVTGDGVNDAPALKAADIGVAMGRSGTDVARGASDLILTDDNFATIVAGIEEGRITFANIRKIVIFVLACGLSEIAMFLGALAVGLPMPLTAVQLLWHNVVTNGAQDVMLGFGRGEGDELKEPPQRGLRRLIDRDALILMIPGAFLMMGFALLILDWQLDQGASIEEARNIVLFSTVLFQNGYIIVLRHLHRPFWHWHQPENGALFLGVTLALSIQTFVMLFAPMRAVLGTGPVSVTIIAVALAGTIGVAFATEGAKRLSARKKGDRSVMDDVREQLAI